MTLAAWIKPVAGHQAAAYLRDGIVSGPNMSSLTLFSKAGVAAGSAASSVGCYQQEYRIALEFMHHPGSAELVDYVVRVQLGRRRAAHAQWGLDWLTGVRLDQRGGAARRWYHLAVTVEADAVHVFVDGVLMASMDRHDHEASVANNRGCRAPPLLIGASESPDTGAVGQFYQGLVDNVQVWRAALKCSDEF